MNSIKNIDNSQIPITQKDTQDLQTQVTTIIPKLENRAENLLKQEPELIEDKVSKTVKDVTNRSLSYTKNKFLPKVKLIANQGIEYTKNKIIPKVKTVTQHGISYTKDNILPKVANVAHKGIEYVQNNVFPKVKEKAQPAIDYMQNVAIPSAKAIITAKLKTLDINILQSYDKASILAILIVASKLFRLPVIKKLPLVSFIPAFTTIFTLYTAFSPIIEMHKNKIDEDCNGTQNKNLNDVSPID